MAKHGWDVSLTTEIDDIKRLSHESNNHENEKEDTFSTELFEVELKEIVNRVSVVYPEQSRIVEEAQKTLKQKMYFSSTSLFVSMADGIYNRSSI